MHTTPRAPVDKSRLGRLNTLLDQALALPRPARPAWLADLPASDHLLLPRLSDLLARAEVETDDFLHQPLTLRIEDLESLQALPDQAGDRIGPYRLLRELGAGGMATVWLAERHDALMQRQVALKLPREGWALGLAQRMAREREILAALEHPRIARLYEAGLTEAGRPWLAMEFVAGETIDQHCGHQALPLTARIELVLQVLDAVAYAHGQLVVHRDLKPGNILVTPSGQVRLLDFGVAKLLHDEGSTTPSLTQLTGRAITPEYAAPELIAGRAVTAATDVYSLGVVLYELLCGQRPFQRQGLTVAALEEAVLGAERPLASSRSDDRTAARLLRGDLDAILDKALRINPAHRYRSAEALATDLRCWLDGRPVQAQRQSRRYRSLKFLRRHRWPLLGAGTVAVSLLGGLGLALWQAQAARTEAARADKVKEFVSSILAQASPRQGSGGAVLAADLLEVAGRRIDTELADYPQAAAELGVIVGQGLSSLGVPQRGEPTLRAAVARAERTLGQRHPTTVRGRALWIESLYVQHPEQAERIIDSVVQDALAGLPATAEPAAIALRQQALKLARREQAEAAYAALQQSIEVARHHLGQNHRETVSSMGLLSYVYGRFGRYKEQLAMASQALVQAQQAMGGQRPDVTLTNVERWYGEALRRNDRPGDALPVLRQVLDDQRVLDATEGPRVRYAMFQLGLALAESGRLGEAIPMLRSVVELAAQQSTAMNEGRVNYGTAYAVVLGFARRERESRALRAELDTQSAAARLVRDSAPPAVPAHDNVQALVQARQVRLLAYAGKFTEAAGESADTLSQAGPERPNHHVEAHLSAALLARLQGRSDEALAVARRGWDAPPRALARLTAQAGLAAELAAAWLDKGDTRRADAAAREALTLFEQAQVQPSPLTATAALVMARLHLQAGRSAEAEQLLRPLAKAWQDAHPGSDWHGETLHWLGAALLRQGKTAEARRVGQQARSMLAGSPVPALARLASADTAAAN